VPPPVRVPPPGPVVPPPPIPLDRVPAPAPLDPGSPDTGVAPAPRIVRIEFVGNALFATESLKVLMTLKEGQPLDAARLDEDMALLFRFFSNVEVLQEDVPGGVVLRFVVSENPLVVELRVYGASEMSEAEIRGMLQTRVGYPLFPYTLASDAQDIVEAYRARGYHFAHVPEPLVTTVCGGGRRVDFTIVEGPKVEVTCILFRGNTCIPRKDLLEAMQTEEEGFLAFLSDAPFREDVLREDIVALQRLYRSEGYLDAEVFLEDLRFSDNRSCVAIILGIVEHRPYCVGDVTIEIVRADPCVVGAPPPEDVAYFDEARIRSMLGLVPGTRYSGKAEDEGRRRILEAYFARSYIDADVPPAILRGREHALVVDVHLVVEEGLKYRLHRIDFVGNEYTRDKVLRREARIVPGGYVDRNELDRTQARLRALNYFDRVTMRVQDAAGPMGEPIAGWKTVTYEVVEARTGKLGFGVGLSTDGGFGGQITYTKRNFDIGRWPTSLSDVISRRSFTGGGQTLNVSIAPGTRVTEFAIAFTEPHFLDTDWSMSVQLFKRFQFWESYIVDDFGYGVGFGHPIVRARDDRYILFGNVRWQHENAEIEDVGDFAVPGAFLFRGDNEVRTLSGDLILRMRDDLANPTWATSSRLALDYSGGVLGGDIDMWRLTASHDHDWLVHEDDEGKRHRLTLSLNGGYAEAFGDTPEVPPFRRFYAGGRAFRGFRYRGVGPHVNGRPTGGEFLLTGSLEYEYPVVKDLLGIVAFVDAGTLAENLDSPDLWDLRLSTGLGVRLKLPILGDRPLAFDFGFPIISGDEDERSIVSFSVGKDF
jgi:outer membrane protein insertion porin family